MGEYQDTCNTYGEWNEWSYDDGDTLGDMVLALMLHQDELKAQTDAELAARLGTITGFNTHDPNAPRPVQVAMLIVMRTICT